MISERVENVKSQKKVYTTPRLTKHGFLVQLTADYIPGMGHVVTPDPDPPPPISAPAIPGSDNGNTPPGGGQAVAGGQGGGGQGGGDPSGVAPPSSGTPPGGGQGGGDQGGGGGQGGGGQGGGDAGGGGARSGGR